MDEYENHEMELPEDSNTADEFDQTPVEEDALDRDTGTLEDDLAEARNALSAAQAIAEQERQARHEMETALNELKKDLAHTAATLDQERQERLNAEKDRAEVQSALEEANRAAIPQAVGYEEISSQEYETEGSKHRLSFIVRLMLDDHGDPRRTEIQETQSGKTENYHTLNGEQLAAFMRSCIRPVAAVASLNPEIPASEPPGEPYTVSISDTLLFDEEAGDAMTLSVRAQEALVVQAGFQLQPSEEAPWQTQVSDYEISVYANEIGGSHSQLMASSYGHLQESVLDYTARMKAPGLAPGVYRLITLVTLHTPTMKTGHYEGPIILVN